MSQYDTPSGDSKNGCVRNASYEKRRGNLAVPLNLKYILNSQQFKALRQMESFGWHLAYVRRAEKNTDQSEPTIIVKNSNKHCFGLLESDGSINTSCSLSIRA